MRLNAIVGGADWAHDVWKRVVRPDEGWAFLNHHDTLGAMHVFTYVFFLNYSHIVDTWTFLQNECVNFHCTRLPSFRGGHPIENLILAGHTETVITAHRITAEIDAGPIYAVSDPVSLTGTKEQILQRFVEPCARLIRQIVETEPTPYLQVGEPTYFKRLTPAAYQQFWAERA